MGGPFPLSTAVQAVRVFWEFNDPANPNDTSILSSPTFTFSDTGVYTVSLIVNPNTPCADTSFERFELRYPLEPESRFPVSCVSRIRTSN